MESGIPTRTRFRSGPVISVKNTLEFTAATGVALDRCDTLADMIAEDIVARASILGTFIFVILLAAVFLGDHSGNPYD